MEIVSPTAPYELDYFKASAEQLNPQVKRRERSSGKAKTGLKSGVYVL
jgi:hypothetical protein